MKMVLITIYGKMEKKSNLGLFLLVFKLIFMTTERFLFKTFC